MYVVTVHFDIEPSHWQAFLVAMRANAAASLDLEPACKQFDVCVSAEIGIHNVFLYEKYESRADFDAHLQMPHFVSFNAETSAWIKSKFVSAFIELNG